MGSSSTHVIWGAASLLVLGLPVPVSLKVLLLLSSRYWLGPVIVYFTQRMAAYPRVEAISNPDPTLAAAQLKALEEILPALRQAGFVERGRMRNADHINPVRVTLVLLQHPETSDIAHAFVGGPAHEDGGVSNVSLWFSRARSDGSRIRTGSSTISSPFPPPPQDNVLALRRQCRPPDLWHAHQARVKEDPRAVPNALIGNALAFQNDLEAQGVDRHVRSGYWSRDPAQTFLRPTPAGALRMTLRMLFPWKQVADLRARLLFLGLAHRTA